MCLPIGGLGSSSQLLVRPNERALKLAAIFRFILGAYLVFGILQFVVLGFFSGLISLLFVGIGYHSIRNSQGFSVMQLPCYAILSAVSAFYSLVTVIQASINANSYLHLQQWQRNMLIAVSILGVVLQLAGFLVSKALYDELRASVNELGPQALLGSDAPGAPGHAQAQAQQAFPAPGSAEFNAPNSGGFRAFQGKGRRLGSV